MTVSIKDVKKGTRVRLRNGWEADVADNKVTSATRVCTVYGIYTEMGSVYTTDIVQARVNGQWETVEHTATQLKQAAARKAFGF